MESTSIESIDTPTELVIRLQYGLSFSCDRMYELRELIRHLTDHIVDGHRKHLSAVEREIGKPVRVLEGN